MRPIKFRGKINPETWVYGYFIKYPDGECVIYNKHSDESTVNTFYFVNPETVGQFTGLHDKNGKEIYEGDILRWISSNPFSLGEIRKVQVNYVEARYWCHGSIGVYLADLLSNEVCEVIGNIYENPELIK